MPLTQGADLRVLWQLAEDAVFSHLMRVTESGGSVGFNGSIPGREPVRTTVEGRENTVKTFTTCVNTSQWNLMPVSG